MPRARLRDLGLKVGTLPPGPFNAITDIPGVKVGYSTVIRDRPRIARTGVTAIWPRGPEIWTDYVFAGTFSFNGNGEMTGLPWLAEQGLLGEPGKAGHLAVAVEGERSRENVVGPDLRSTRPDGGDSRPGDPGLILDDGRVAHLDARDVGDGVEGPGWQGADCEAEIAQACTRHCFALGFGADEEVRLDEVPRWERGAPVLLFFFWAVWKFSARTNAILQHLWAAEAKMSVTGAPRCRRDGQWNAIRARKIADFWRRQCPE